MAYKKKTWTEKLQDNKNYPKTNPFEENMPCGKDLAKWGTKPGDTVVIAPPSDVNMVMKHVVNGHVITIYEI
jgi:hypothetical protein